MEHERAGKYKRLSTEDSSSSPPMTNGLGHRIHIYPTRALFQKGKVYEYCAVCYPKYAVWQFNAHPKRRDCLYLDRTVVVDIFHKFALAPSHVLRQTLYGSTDLEGVRRTCLTSLANRTHDRSHSVAFLHGGQLGTINIRRPLAVSRTLPCLSCSRRAFYSPNRTQ